MQRNKKPATLLASRALAFALLALLVSSPAWAGEKVLFTFNGADGLSPIGNLVADGAGNLYGVTVTGGIDCAPNPGCGVVFRLSKSSGVWKETVLHKFTGGNDGYYPSSLTIDSAGNLYGTTNNGGGKGGSCNHFTDCGVVFRLTPATSGTWPEKILYRFSGGDGADPTALAFDSHGNLFGTARNGGGGSTGCAPTGGCGVVFELTPTASGPWKLTPVHVFTYNTSSDPGLPIGLAIGAGDAMYVTADASIVQFVPGAGGWTFSVIHYFNSNSDGMIPVGTVILDSAGNVYGTTSYGGSLNRGVVYELSPHSGGGWTESILYSFAAGIDGRNPSSGLAFDAAGNLYGGTTYGGGTSGKCIPNGCGTIFKLAASSSTPWPESLPIRFVRTNGSQPTSSLILNTDGNLYGTASLGGANNDGVLFELTP